MVNPEIQYISLSNGLIIERGDTFLCTENITVTRSEKEKFEITKGDIIEIISIQYHDAYEDVYVDGKHIRTGEMASFPLNGEKRISLDGLVSRGTFRIFKELDM